MHPLLTDRHRLIAYLAASLPLTLATTGLLSRGPSALPLNVSVSIALPLSVGSLVLLLPVWYLCRALPADETPWGRLLLTHGAGALLAGGSWASVGAGLARLSASANPEMYAVQVPAVLAGGATVYLLAVAFHYVLLGHDATRRAEQRSMALAVLAREAELRALKAQVQPHFLFNSLNSISSLVGSDPTRAREMCVLLAEFFRRSLALGDRADVTLDEELAVARTYLAIEGLRLGTRLIVDEAIDDGARACRLPPLLLQPLVENAVRHGIATRAEGGVLRIEAQTDGRRLRLAVLNPFDPDAPARHGMGLGLGLANVRGRLLARYGEDAVLDAHRGDDRFRVALTLPAEVRE